MQDINLLPQSELVEQSKARVTSLSTVVSIIFLVLIALFSGYVIYRQGVSKKQIAELDTKINAARAQITAMADIEVTVRNLDKKYTALQKIFTDNKKYSLLMTELRSRKPSGMVLENVDLKEGKMSVNGTADNYVSIADFINSLLNKKFEGGIKDLQEVFTIVSLNSVSMESSKNTIQFFIVVDFDSSKLK
jgi:Tfp pilus assembly protein PilN